MPVEQPVSAAGKLEDKRRSWIAGAARMHAFHVVWPVRHSKPSTHSLLRVQGVAQTETFGASRWHCAVPTQRSPKLQGAPRASSGTWR